jgi:YD repeat-containing protein
VFETVQSGYGLPESGSVTTLYNESDQATEVQIRDDKGSVVSRVIRTYGTNGQPSEEKQILENLAPMFLDRLPTEERAKFGPARIKAMNKGLITMMGGGGGTSYTYDAQNRITETHLRILFFETVTTIAYNDHGDIAEERRTSISREPKRGSFSIDENGDLIPTQEASETPGPPEPLPEETHYTYQYDSYGNWTERTLTRSDGFSLATRRHLTCY